MKGTKKISDFLSDEKASSIGKREHLILTNGGKIVWVIGLRIDDGFKVTSETKKNNNGGTDCTVHVDCLQIASRKE